MSEAKVEGNNIILNGYFKASILGFASFVIGAFVFLASNVIANDRKYIDMIHHNKTNIAEFKATLKAMQGDLGEIKTLLRRTAPYERVK